MLRATMRMFVILVSTCFATAGCGGSSGPSDQLIEQLVMDHFKHSVPRTVLSETANSMMLIPKNGEISSLKVLRKEEKSRGKMGGVEMLEYSCEIEVSGTYQIMNARGQWKTEPFQTKTIPLTMIKGLEGPDTWSLDFTGFKL
ncbi:MAG: hypothetical protein KAV87_52205 [Desulfobacteraceae bacterium]|nr:hypothetical protein [Desulfobacteraceae bacterium]